MEINIENLFENGFVEPEELRLIIKELLDKINLLEKNNSKNIQFNEKVINIKKEKTPIGNIEKNANFVELKYEPTNIDNIIIHYKSSINKKGSIINPDNILKLENNKIYFEDIKEAGDLKNVLESEPNMVLFITYTY